MNSIKPAIALLFALVLGLSGCATQGLRPAVDFTMQRAEGTPKDASVYIDEEYVAPLYVVQAHGIRLPEGEHRITVQKEGFFPYDKLVKANRKPIHLDVELEPVPD